MASGKSSILLLFVLRFLVGVGAYAIDDSCKSHATDQQDKTDIIKSAMSAARNMAVDAANTIIMNNHLGNARDQLFKDSTPNHWYQIQDKYQLLVQKTPWALTSHRSILLDRVTIYCGDYNFAPNPDVGPSVWTDTSTGSNVYSTEHNGDLNVRLCQPGSAAFTLDYILTQNPIGHSEAEREANIIVLCDTTLIQGTSPVSTGSQPTLSDINTLGGIAGLYYGKPLDWIMYATCISSTLVHELMHVTQSASFFRGGDEVYGWLDISRRDWDLASKLRNIDNYAYYATAVSLPPPYFVFNGDVIHA